jgi:SAM-dependent methyltransferase
LSRGSVPPIGFDDGPDEPLGESAPLAWRDAPVLCAGDCLPYHRVWQYLRWLGLITSIRTNTDFLAGTFRRLASSHPRVLVSGTADYGMLAQLHHAYGAAPLHATVVDLCPTPLMLNRWYGDRFGRTVRTAQHDAVSYGDDSPFDLVVTHNFVGRFDDASRRRLVANWWRLLRPGGQVVTTQRVRPHAPAGETGYPEDKAEELAQIAASAAARAGFTAADTAAFRDTVREYARRKKTMVIGSTAEITDCFESCGFAIDLLDEGGGAAERERDRPSSLAGLDTFRMRLIARKPGAG